MKTQQHIFILINVVKIKGSALYVGKKKKAVNCNCHALLAEIVYNNQTTAHGLHEVLCVSVFLEQRGKNEKETIF